ncbi:MAG: hypothetical protein ABI844_16980 [Saprospiraceae bacterium]
MKYILFYIIFPLFTHSQNADQRLADLFFKNKTVVWQKTYSGIWDDAIPVKLELLSDGESCKGFLYFGENKSKYIISGKQIMNELRLEEQDLNSNITGLIVLQLNGNSARGTWYNSSHSFNARLSLKEGNESTTNDLWIKSFSSKNDPAEAHLIMQKEFADQLDCKFYYKMLNKTLQGTSMIKDDEVYNQEVQLEDYLHHLAGTLHSYKVNDKRVEVWYKLGNIEYNQTLEITNQIPIVQETYADHIIAVDINYPKIDKSPISNWTKQVIDSFLNTIQNKKQLSLTDQGVSKDDRLLYRMSIWPKVDFLNDQYISGTMNIKNSWEENIVTIPFFFDLKRGTVLGLTEIIADRNEFESLKNKLLNKELEKLKLSSSLDYKSLKVSDFSTMTIKKEGIAFTAPFDLVYGFRQIILPYYEIRQTLSTKYFPL